MDESYIVKSPFKSTLDQSGDLFQYLEASFNENPDNVALVSLQ